MVSKAIFRGLIWDLTLNHALDIVSLECTYCGGTGGGIDRIDSGIGYTIGNSVPCCAKCNDMKGILDVEDWFSQMRRIINR